MERVAEMRRQGRDIINFGSRGDTPQQAKAAAVAMLQSESAAGYTDARGLAELRDAIAAKLQRDNGIVADPEREIVVSSGGMEGVFATMQALVGPGDEVLVADPAWHGFRPMVQLAGATPVLVPLDPDGYRLRIAVLREYLTPRTKLLILCNPANPTGVVLTRAELLQIAELACACNLLVLVDEAYENFVYDGRRHISLASLDGMRQRTVTVQTVSKIYNMFGWRVGWVVAAPELIEAVLAVHAWSVGCPASFAQAGAAAVLRGTTAQGDRPIDDVVRRYQDQRDAMVRGLRGIPGVTCALPEGAYFAFPDFSAYRRSSEELCGHLLESGGVATTPGAAFGATGEGHLRLVFNAPVAEIERGIARIAEVLAKIAD